MMQSTDDRGLIVRHHEREAVELPAEIIVGDHCAHQVQFSMSADTPGPHCMVCTVVDISPGGLGVEARQFLPRMLEGVIRIFSAQNGDRRSDNREVLLEHPVKVRRAEMIGREPRFGLGLAFLDRTPELDARVSELIASLGGNWKTSDTNDAATAEQPGRESPDA